MRRVSDEVREQILEMSRRNVKTDDIADRVGVSTRTVQRVRTAAGVALHRAPLMTDAEKRRAKAMLDDGASYCEVGRTLRRAADTITRNFPGYQWDKTRTGAAAAMGRELARLERQVALG